MGSKEKKKIPHARKLHQDTRVKMTVNEFGIADYAVFGCMLLISSAIGVYHAYGGKQSSTKEYLMAGKGMSCFPIFVSLLASYLSAITLLGVPSEIYTYGVQYCVLILSYFILCTTAAVIYAPVFYRLNLTSAHEVMKIQFLSQLVESGMKGLMFPTVTNL